MSDDPTKCVICQQAPRYQYQDVKFVTCAACTLDHVFRVTEYVEAKFPKDLQDSIRNLLPVVGKPPDEKK